MVRTVSSDMKECIFFMILPLSRGNILPLCYPKDGDMLLRNVGKVLPDYTASEPSKRRSACVSISYLTIVLRGLGFHTVSLLLVLM
jgi:hypothetical protein